MIDNGINYLGFKPNDRIMELACGKGRAKSLLLAAMIFPEFEHSNKWEKRARSILYKEIRTQVYDDGVHGELSTHYHRVIVGELLEILVLHWIKNIARPAERLCRL